MAFVALGLADWGNKEMEKKKKTADTHTEELVSQVSVAEQSQASVILEEEAWNCLSTEVPIDDSRSLPCAIHNKCLDSWLLA